MKAKPVKEIKRKGQTVLEDCEPSEATHVWICFPETVGKMFTNHCLPVVQAGSRDKASHARGVPVWTWNGDVDKPTLKPSILSQTDDERVHVWLNDGKIQVLNDSTYAGGQTLDLEEVDL